MRLAVFSGQYFWFDGEHYSTDEAFVKFVTSFHPYFSKIVLCDSIKEEKKVQDYVLDPGTIEVCALPYFSVYSFWKNVFIVYPEICRIIENNIHNWDIAWLHVPHPVSLIFAYIFRKHGKPFFLVVRQNLLEQVRHRNKGIKKAGAMAVVATLEYVSRRIAENHVTFAVGKEMYESYKERGGPVYETAVSLVSRKEIEIRSISKAPNLHKPLRLLSVGRLDREKGLNFLIEAVNMLIRRKGMDIQLQIVGRGFRGAEEERLRKQVDKHQLPKHVHFLGYVSHGSELFQLYRDSDIFVLPSLTGEGIPQTLFEAMACAVPIITVRVGGIPSVVKDKENGLLISPGSPKEICSAIELLVKSPKLRKKLLINGLATAKDHTLEAERDRMMSHIEAFAGQIRPRLG